MTAQPVWLIPISDGSEPIRIEIRSERVVPPCVFVDLRMPTRLLTAVEATQLGMALCEASKVAAEMWVKEERRRKRG
jgi:hypothetical protein